MNIPWSRPVQTVLLILMVQIGVYYLLPNFDNPPPVPNLAAVSSTVASWQSIKEYPVETEVQAVLKADATLNRLYMRSADQMPASLFIAFFKTQSAGVAPHSPRNCLPGSGWVPSSSSITKLALPQGGELEVNRYIVKRGEEQSLVLYWYQSGSRSVASEYTAKFYTMADRFSRHRSDTSLVRVVIPCPPQMTMAVADAAAMNFVAAIYPEVLQVLPQ